MGPIESNTNYPLSSEPAEGYGSDPVGRNGKVILTNALNGKHIIVTEGGYRFTADRKEATQFDSHAEAAVKAAELVAGAKAKQAQEKEAVLVD